VAAQRGRKRAQNPEQSSKEGKLRPWLVKCAFAHRLFGMKSFQDFQGALAGVEEGEGEDGHDPTTTTVLNERYPIPEGRRRYAR